MQKEFLLPDDTISLFKSVDKPNPKNSMWRPMKLYLRKHAREKAYARFGGAEGLAQEKEKREQLKFSKQLKEAAEMFGSGSVPDSLMSSSSEPPGNKAAKAGRSSSKKVFQSLAEDILAMNSEAKESPVK